MDTQFLISLLLPPAPDPETRPCAMPGCESEGDVEFNDSLWCHWCWQEVTNTE